MSNLSPIAAARTRMGLTQANLAAKVGISTSYLSLIENGRRTSMSAETFLALVRALDFTSSERSALEASISRPVEASP